MANGRLHDFFNIFLLVLITPVLLVFDIHLVFIFLFILGWLFSTLLFGPDTDLMPKKRTHILGVFLYPYSLFSKHRGLSHHPILGTILRVIYGFLVFIFVSFVLKKMGYIEHSPEGLGNFLINYFENFNFQSFEYLVLIWIYLGMWGADLSHLLLDKISFGPFK